MQRISFALAVVLISCVAAVADAPKIVSEDPVFNFGDRDNVGDVSHSFAISNEGSAPLEIFNVKTSCGCTVAELKDKVLEPGDATTIDATLSLEGREGLQRKTIMVQSNDPLQPALQLIMTGAAVAPIQVEPRMVNFGRIVDDGEHGQVVTIEAAKKSARFRIAGVEISNESLSAVARSSKDGARHRLTLTTKKGAAPGNLTGTVTIKTDNPKFPTVQFNTYGQVVGPLSYAPEHLILTERGGARMTSRAIRIMPGRVEHFQILDIETPSPEIESEILPQRTRGYLIRLTNLPEAAKLDGESVRVHTDAEGMEEIVIPFKMMQTPAPVTQ